MLRYQASIYSGDQYDNNETDNCHAHLQPSTMASSNGMRGQQQQQQQQQGRVIKRQPAPTYKSIPTSRLAPRRRYFVMDAQKSHSNSCNSSASGTFQFPGPDYLKRMKENYENGKIIYIRRNNPGLKNSSIPSKMTSTITNSIRSTTYHTTTTTVPSGKVTVETTGNVPKYVFRLPKTSEFSTVPGSKFDENRPNTNNMYVPAYEPVKMQYTTVPACMSMGGEYLYEEEVEEETTRKDSNDMSQVDCVPKTEQDEDCAYLKTSGQLVHHSSTGTTTSSSSTCSTPSYMNNQNGNNSNSTYKMLPLRNRLQPTRFTCPQQDCFWRGPTDMALRKHMQVHGAKQPVIYSGNKPNGTNSNDPQVKVQLVQPKPKGVKCSECDTFAYSRPLLLRHMHDSHGIEAPLIRRTFANREMLQTWLDSLRETHAVEFVVSSGSKKWGRGLQVHYLTCSRSGDQKERPNKKYVRPPRPSIKCGRNCMAYLKIKQNPTVSELQIEGCLHHSGHEIDHTRMMLEPNELSSVGCIVDAVNEGMDIMGSVETLRSYLGNSGRFRLVNDRGIIEQMPVWFDQYHRAMSDYMNDGSHPIPSMYRGSGALAIPATQNGQAKSGRRFNFAMNRDIKREMDYEYKSVPIRFNGNTIQRNYGQQQTFTPTLYDEKKIKIEVDEEENLASQSLLNNENCLMEMKHEDIFDSPMIGGEEGRLLEDDDILCGGEEASGITSTIDGILNANLPDNFGDVMCGVDDLNTDFNCGMDDAEFNELLGFDFDQRGSINCS